MEAAVALKTVRDDYDRVQVEITSLRSRPTNIPPMLQLRERCASGCEKMKCLITS